VEAAFFGLHEAVGQVDDRELKYVKTSVELRAQLDKIEETAHIANFGFKGMADSLENVGTKVRDLGPDIQHQFVGPIQDATTQVLSFKQSLDAIVRGNFAQGFSNLFKGLNDVFERAFEGGGGVIGAVKSYATNVGKALIDMIPVVGPYVAQFAGAIVEGVSKLFGHLFGPSELDKTHKALNAFIHDAGGITDLTAQATAAGVSLDGLFNARTQAGLSAAIATLKAALETQNLRQAFIDVSGGLDTLNERARIAGTTLDAVLSARTPEAYRKAIEDLNKAFDFQDAAMKTLNDTVKKYGFTIDQLGPTYAKQQLHERAGEMLQDWKVLDAAGISHVEIIKKMGPSLQEYVNQSSITGNAIPEQLRPALQTMIDMGMLTDTSGQKLTDLSSLTFADTLDAKFDTVIGKIGDLIDAITRGLGGALTSIPQPPPVHIPVVYDIPDLPRRESDYAAMGGYVTANGIQHLAGGGNVLRFMPRGSDVVPAMLTPGEGVLNRGAMGRIGGAAGLHRLNAGGGSGALSVSIGNITVEQGMTDQQAEEMIGRTVVKGMRRYGVRFSNR
jgi:hypothetical protein